MKINKIIIIGAIAAMIMGCNSLNVPPMNIVNDNDVFTSESGITAYFARLYYDLPIEDYMYNKDGFNQIPQDMEQDFTGESMRCNMPLSNINGSFFPYWNYDPVRNMNYFLQEFPKYATSFPSSEVQGYMGEIHFLRAYHYFAMVKRYGGVPIVTKVLNYPQQSIEELKAPRNLEKDCYDFILADLDSAINLLPGTSLALGRVNKYVAYGLKARVALFAASIAKYGQVQLNGILGIPSDQAKGYFQTAYDAAMATNGKYSLYNKGGDLAVNYTNIFLDQSSPENMFVKYYHYPDYAHSFELFMVPWQVRGAQNYSGRANPTLDFVEMFDDTDGNPYATTLNTGTDVNPVYYNSPVDLFSKAEPRLAGLVIFPGATFMGTTIEVRKGIVKSGDPITKITSTSSFTDTYNGMTIQGASGMGYGDCTYTGFYMRKWLDPNIQRADIGANKTATPWIDMRYAEMLLIRAEAAIELQSLGDNSKVDDAVSCINAIRARAGAKRMYTSSDLTIDLVRKERRMELFYENKIFWDLKRWRIYDKEFTSRQLKVLWPIYVWDQQKYYMKQTVFSNWAYTFLPTYYYQQIPTAEIQKNDLLVQNPGY